MGIACSSSARRKRTKRRLLLLLLWWWWMKRGSEKEKEISSVKGPVCLWVFSVRHCWVDLEVGFSGRCRRLPRPPLLRLRVSKKANFTSSSSLISLTLHSKIRLCFSSLSPRLNQKSKLSEFLLLHSRRKRERESDGGEKLRVGFVDLGKTFCFFFFVYVSSLSLLILVTVYSFSF